MIQLCIGSICTIVVMLSGALLQAGSTELGFAFLAVGTIGNAILLTRAMNGWQTGTTVASGLTVGVVTTVIQSTDWMNSETPIYVADHGIHRAGSVWTCLLDGQRAIVIEAQLMGA